MLERRSDAGPRSKSAVMLRYGSRWWLCQERGVRENVNVLCHSVQTGKERLRY